MCLTVSLQISIPLRYNLELGTLIRLDTKVYFNSTKVQFGEVVKKVEITITCEFQFH